MTNVARHSSEKSSMKPVVQNKWCKFFLLVSLIPVCLQAISIFRYGVNVPYWDQWCMPPIFEKIAEGHFTFKDLLVQQNEHRPASAFLFSIALTRISDWDVRYEMLFSFFLVCIIALLIYRLIRLALSNVTLAAITFLAADFLIFSPIQIENWFQGIQICIYIALASFVGCLVVSSSKYHPAVKFLICAVLCTISTFSFANGMVGWIVVPVVLVSESKEYMKKIQGKVLILFWTVAFLFNMILYFHDYYSPPWHPSLKEGLYHPIQALFFFLAFLGNSLGMGHAYLAVIVGGTSLLIWFALVVFFFYKQNREVFLNNYVRWIMMAGFSLISGIIITVSRVGLKQAHNCTLRYTSHSLYLIISLICLLAIAVEKVKLESSPAFRRIVYFVFSFTVIFVVLMYCESWTYDIKCIKAQRERLLQGKACMLLSNFIKEKKGLEILYPDMDTIIARTNIIDKLGMLKPPLIKDPDIRNIDGGAGKEIICGYFDGFSRSGTGEYFVSGWAVLPERKEQADAVILTYDDGDGREILFNIILERVERLDVVQHYQKDFYLNSGWNKKISEADIPKQAVRFNAWAFDTESGKAFKLRGSHSLEF